MIIKALCESTVLFLYKFTPSKVYLTNFHTAGGAEYKSRRKDRIMKNIHEILKSYDIEIPEDKKADFDKAVTENYKTVAEVNKLRESRDSYKSQLDTATTTLKEFEGVDVKELQGKITKLNEQLETQKTDFEKQIAENEFNSLIDSALTKGGAKNAKAVKALLDLDVLRESKNQGEDISAAISKIKEENDYLFVSNEPLDNGKIVGQTNGKTPKSLDDISKMSYDEYKEYRKNN